MSKKILVTGGCGYIGGHTIVDLVNNGFEVISVDNYINGLPEMNEGIAAILGKEIKNYNVDLCDFNSTVAIFEENQDIVGVIHFAALKSVPQSVEEPLLYFYNNNTSLVNVLKCCATYNIDHFIFSSSCSVYGNAETLPVTEDTPLKEPESPYARTKVMGEQICFDTVKANTDLNITLLRYFNPVGAHPSGRIGEMNKRPENLVPVITQTAIGKRASMSVFGDDYDTRDGSCIRDYIHVMDIAHAHTLALKKSLEIPSSGLRLYNLGTGNGVSVFELINAFEQVSGVQLNYDRASRRPGDVVEVYADRSKATKELNWNPTTTINQMMASAWKWEQNFDQIVKEK